ncbi:NADPH-dependent FMN reductase [Corynebacterium sp.]|uniref:NADPH-dependent FMN reductase n=1 Tax=Corynebacterium sp. TaxID=1720 RepID=UPI0026DDB693|nr:NAD(P)H-dependent oxidoreductase [Corynebacterium sp.]MDO4609059.1 NAD(P)H-dependent oxidoreductase [Corynebacterium sp.]
MKIGIITGTTRHGNNGSMIGDWVNRVAAARDDAEFTDIRLADQDLNLLTEPTMPGMANGEYEDPKTAEWAKAIAPLDGFVFITPEYNAAPPAAFKNAVDLLFVEWSGKPVGFVGYGFHHGERAVAHWRDIVGNLKMTDVAENVGIGLGEELAEDGSFVPAEGREAELNAMLDEVVRLATK